MERCASVQICYGAFRVRLLYPWYSIYSSAKKNSTFSPTPLSTHRKPKTTMIPCPWSVTINTRLEQRLTSSPPPPSPLHLPSMRLRVKHPSPASPTSATTWRAPTMSKVRCLHRLSPPPARVPSVALVLRHATARRLPCGCNAGSGTGRVPAPSPLLCRGGERGCSRPQML